MEGSRQWCMDAPECRLTRPMAVAGNADEKSRTIQPWESLAGSQLLVGTSSLGAGLDYCHVRVVLHVDEPYG